MGKYFLEHLRKKKTILGDSQQGKKKANHKKFLIGIGSVVVILLLVILGSELGGVTGRNPDNHYPYVQNAQVSSKTFNFKVDRAWATDTIQCPKEQQEYYGSKTVSPIDDNAIFYIVEYTFTNTSDQSIDERPTVRLVDSSGIVYGRDEAVSVMVRQGGTSTEYGVYDEGVLLDQPMGPGLSLKGQCTFIVAKDRLNRNGAIVCSRPQIRANSAVAWLTGFNFGTEEAVQVSLGSQIEKSIVAVPMAGQLETQTVMEYETQMAAETFRETEIEIVGTVGVNEPYRNDVGNAMNEPHVIIPDSSNRELTDADVQELTAEQLCIAINEIYARHGQRFKDTGLQIWFDAQAWYQGTVAPENFQENVLSQTEKDNIKLLQKKKDGGTLSSNRKALSGKYKTRFEDEGSAELEIVYGFGDDIFAAEFGGSWMDYAGDTTGYLDAKTDGTDGIWYYYADGIDGPAMQIKYDGYDSITVTSLADENFGGVGFPGFRGTYQRIAEYPMP